MLILGIRVADDEHIAGRELRNEMLTRFCGIEDPESHIDIADKGKPYLKDMNIGFSVSHSHGIAICCVNTGSSTPLSTENILPFDSDLFIWDGGSDFEIGADIEFINDAVSEATIERISRRCYSSDEKKLLTDNESRFLNFFRMWTMKESFGKLKGSGLASVSLLDTENSPKELEFHSHKVSFNGKDFIISVCFNKDS